MTSLDEKIAALFRKGSPTSADAEPAPSVDHPIVEEAPSEAVVSEPAGEEENETWDDDKPGWKNNVVFSGDYGSENKLTMGGIGFGCGDPSPLALRDIQAMRTKLTPVSPSDLNTLIEMGMVEMRDDAPMLTNEGHQAID